MGDAPIPTFGWDSTYDKYVLGGGLEINGNVEAARLRLTATNDVYETSTDHALQIGPDSGSDKTIFDGNEIMTLDGAGTPKPTYFQYGIGTDTASYTPSSPGHLATKEYVDELVQVPVQIPGGANLNDYQTTGIYHQHTNANASSGSNYPVKLAGLLEVVNAVTAGFRYQTYTTYGTNSIVFRRNYYNGTWSEWRFVSPPVATAWLSSTSYSSGASAQIMTLANLDSSGGFTLQSGQFRIPADGWYSITARVSWAANSTGNRAGVIFINGSAVGTAGVTQSNSAGNTWNGYVGLVERFVEGDLVGIGGWQTSGGALTGAANARIHGV